MPARQRQEQFRKADQMPEKTGEMSADGGKYQRVIGDSKSECEVTVKVKFEKYLKDETLYEDETLQLKCQLNKPDVSVKWLKDGQEITEQERIKISTDACAHQLIISDVSLADGGSYQCVFGDLASECKVTIKEGHFALVDLSKLSMLVLLCAVVLPWLIVIFGSSREHSSLISDEKGFGTQGRIEEIEKTVESLQNENVNFDSFFKFQNEMVAKHTECETRYQSVVESIRKISSDFSTMAHKSDMNNEVSILQKKINETEKNLNMTIEQIGASVNNKFKTLSKSLSKFEATVTENQMSFEEFKRKTDNEIQSVSASFSAMKITMEHDFKSRLENVKVQLNAIENAKVEADEILKRIKKDVDKMYPNTFNKEALTAAFLILAVLVFLLAFWIYRVQARLPSSDFEHNESDGADVLQRTPSRMTLRNSICIVSFDEARREAHETMVKSAIPTGQDINIEYFVVRRHEHLRSLPRCKFYVVCTEFSERHVIIEEPGLGLGDLKRCTYEKIQKYKAGMIILYTRDPGSRNLGDQMYNNRIHCVTTQPELRALSDRGRFISTYDELTDLQKRSINDTILECLQ